MTDLQDTWFDRRSVAMSRRRWLIVGALGFALLGTLPPVLAAAQRPTQMNITTDGRGLGSARPTVVLVHGAWADASSWTGEIARLRRAGYTVVAPPDPLRGLQEDAGYLRNFLATIGGPIVLVGHSYGGAVITNAATGNPNVKALVYVDAFIPAHGETLGQLTGSQSCLAGGLVDPAKVFDFVQDPALPPGDVDTYLKVEATSLYPGFAQCFANGLPASRAAELAATQRPLAVGVLNDQTGIPAWQTIPSWALIGTNDRVIPAAQQKAMATRANAQISEFSAGHLGLISRPDEVVDVILDAIHAMS